MGSKKKINSRRKGVSGELELSHELERVFGCDSRRGQQYSGSPDSPDVVTDITGVHFECKRCEKLSIYQAITQAEDDRGIGEVPVVCHRRNNMKWLAIVPLDLLPALAANISKHRSEGNGK